MKKILLTGGGTAGHIVPNLALLPYLKDYELHYAGQKGGMEEELLRDFPFVTFHRIPCVKLTRSFTLKNAAIPFKLIDGIAKSKKLLKQLQPALVFSKGGFVALPLMLACGKKYPMLLHESDFSMGLSNRLGAKNCKAICCGFDSLTKKYPNAVFTGTPLRQELYFGDKTVAMRQSRLTQNGKPNLLIMGGSQGAGAINEVVFAAINELCATFNVVHLTGKKNENILTRPDYFQLPFCTNMADYYAWADFAVSRGGANALGELVALKIPSLIIPLPKGNSRGDQIFNAEYYQKRNCVQVLNQDGMTAGKLLSALNTLISDRASLIGALNAIPSPDGTRRIANLIKQYLNTP